MCSLTKEASRQQFSNVASVDDIECVLLLKVPAGSNSQMLPLSMVCVICCAACTACSMYYGVCGMLHEYIMFNVDDIECVLLL